MSEDASVFTIERVVASDLLELRRRVLRDGRDDPPATHAGDDAVGTIHLAARDSSGVVVGCVSLVRETRSFGDVDVPVQLCLMAVDPSMQATGVGAALVAEAQRSVAPDAIWAAARSTALGFYERCGFDIVSDEYIGRMDLPHHDVVWRGHRSP